MNSRYAFLACLAGLVCSSCVSTDAGQGTVTNAQFVPGDRIQIQSRCDIREVNAANLGSEAHRCVPQLSATSKAVVEQAAKLPLPRGTVVSLSHIDAANFLVIAGSNSICLRQSTARYPIFAGEVFLGTVNPMGVPPDITDRWYAELAKRIAETGRTTAAYVFPNGNAYIASYWIDPPLKTRLYYSSEFKKAGTWESGTYDFRFANQNLTSVSTTTRNGSKTKSNPIEGR